ncbi:unnamed protein product [marine sediment metagenome]|uniref:Uncharacterized protein n=1 Tax=marine sediment metagenome TaxID=412755 RepID=X1FZX9_9ZZZZ
MKTIQVKEATWKKLQMVRLKLRIKTLDQVIVRHFNLVKQYKLEKEMEMIE